MINLLNFPHNLEEMMHENESFRYENFSMKDWVNYLIFQRKISRENLAEYLKITLKELTKLENDTSVPSEDRVIKMLKITD